MEYETLLDEAYGKVKPIQHSGERFETPKVEGMVEGSKTIITNFNQICSYLRRDPNHLLKYLLKELATSGQIKGDRVILQIKVSSSRVNEKIQEYVKEFVFCHECKKPDTELVKKDTFIFMHCLACGARKSMRAKL